MIWFLSLVTIFQRWMFSLFGEQHQHRVQREQGTSEVCQHLTYQPYYDVFTWPWVKIVKAMVIYLTCVATICILKYHDKYGYLSFFWILGQDPWDMSEAAQELENLSNGVLGEKPFLDVSWSGPYIVLSSFSSGHQSTPSCRGHSRTLGQQLAELSA